MIGGFAGSLGGIIPTAYRRNARGLRDRQAFEGVRVQTGALFAAAHAQPVFTGRYLLDWSRIAPRIDLQLPSLLANEWPEYQDLAFPAGETTEVKAQGSHMESPDSMY
jgi:hypothetical protein